jgi:hypothetical protein
MAEGFAYSQWDQDFEGPVAKRMRVDHPYHQYPTDDDTVLTTPETIHHLSDPATNELQLSPGLFHGQWTSFLQDAQIDFASLPEDLSSHTQTFSNNSFDYEDPLYAELNEQGAQDITINQNEISHYQHYAPNQVDERSQDPPAVPPFSENPQDEHQMCFGMVRGTEISHQLRRPLD